MSDVIPYRAPRRPRDRALQRAMLGAIGGFGFASAALLIAFALLRVRGALWPPLPKASWPRLWPVLEGLVMSAAALALRLGLFRVRRRRPLELSAALIVALLCAAFFLAMQAMLFWRLTTSGLAIDPPGLARVLLALAALHGVQVVAGVAALVVLLVRSVEGSYSPARHLGIGLWTLYWQAAAGTWWLIVLCVFCL